MAMSVLYIQGNGRLAGEIRGGVWTSYIGDTLGSCIATTDGSGTITSTADFWPNGEIASTTGTNPSPWGFCGLLGYFTDLASRLYVRARHLNTALARWLTVDPLWPRQPAYGYCSSSPVTHSDRSGLFLWFGGKPTCAQIRADCRLIAADAETFCLEAADLTHQAQFRICDFVIPEWRGLCRRWAQVNYNFNIQECGVIAEIMNVICNVEYKLCLAAAWIAAEVVAAWALVQAEAALVAAFCEAAPEICLAPVFA